MSNTKWRVDLAYAQQPPEFTTPPMLMWTDPPFGTGSYQRSSTNNRYYDGADTRYVVEAICAWLPAMAVDATICICCDYRLAPTITEAIKSAGWAYRGEIVWEFGLGKPRTSWWPVRHNNILTFTRNINAGVFHKEAVPRVKRLRGGGTETIKGKTYTYPNDKPAGSVWDFTFSNNDSRRNGYPNQKATEIISPFVLAHTNIGDTVVDPFAGSGSTGVAALQHQRSFYGMDINMDAVHISSTRLMEMSK